MINLHNIDCMEFMRGLPDKAYALAIVNPPYGLGEKLTSGGTWSVKWQDRGAQWDVRPSLEYFIEIQRVSINWIIWGGNYFANMLPPCRNFVAWHKPYMDGMHSMSNVELALTSFDANSKCVSINKDGGANPRIHVCQKPVALYKWLLQNYAQPGDNILDTHLGSGSISIACHDLGYSLDGCEIDADYYRDAVARYERHAAQMQMFNGDLPNIDKPQPSQERLSL